MFREIYNANPIHRSVLFGILTDICDMSSFLATHLIRTAMELGSYTANVNGHRIRFYYVTAPYGGPGFTFQCEDKPGQVSNARAGS